MTSAAFLLFSLPHLAGNSCEAMLQSATTIVSDIAAAGVAYTHDYASCSAASSLRTLDTGDIALDMVRNSVQKSGFSWCSSKERFSWGHAIGSRNCSYGSRVVGLFIDRDNLIQLAIEASKGCDAPGIVDIELHFSSPSNKTEISNFINSIDFICEKIE